MTISGRNTIFGSSIRRRRTKIICTLGPSSASEKVISRLARAGMNCARLNFSHGTLSDHAESMRAIRKVSSKLKNQIAIMQDLPGPKIRVGQIANGSLTLRRGQIISLLSDKEGAGKQDAIPIHKLNLAKYVSERSTIFLADGTIRLEVMDKTRDELKCRCLNGGVLFSGKGINIPEIQKSFQGFTDQDQEFLEFGLKNKVDLVAVSFIRTSKEMERVRAFAKSRTNDLPWFISKIERREAVQNSSSIIKVSDAVMVARGDLGVENPIEQVPVIQKTIIEDCNRQAVPVITATQMLESMVGNPRPTRAETTDVANAVFDGTDALMLSEETAVGSYPIECVRVLDKVARVAESWYRQDAIEKNTNSPSRDFRGLSVAAARLASETRSRYIVCATSGGSLARQISCERPDAEIIAITNASMSKKLQIVRDVFPLAGSNEIFHSPSTRTLESSTSNVILRNKLAKPGERVIFASNALEGKSGYRKSELLLALEVTK